jgi:natural product biosynthesis luciferase-like monooxygenase protein
MNDTTIDCLFIGNESLLVRCAELARSAGWRITLVVSEDAAVTRWAAAHDVPCLGFDPGLPARLGPAAVDYVFSVGNLRVLSWDWLALARRLAVNFHDAPLPRYRGLHATSWALLHGETEHGVTWHEAVEAVDEGAILAQERFPIAPDDTALTLNARCFDAGARTFAALVDDLAAGPLVGQPQPAGAAHYFGKARRPHAAGFVDWTRPLAEIDALVRALDFGPYTNPLCLPWSLAAGRVVRVDGATVDRAGRGEQGQWDRLDIELARRIGAHHEAWCGAERTWVTACAALQPLDLPIAAAEQAPAIVRLRPDVGRARERGSAWIAAATAIWLAREAQQDVFDLAHRGPTLDAQLAGLERWFEPLPPVRLAVDLGRPFDECRQDIERALDAHDRRGSFLHDLPERYPELRTQGRQGLGRRLGVALTVGDDAAAAADTDAALVVHVSPDGACEWRVDTTRLPIDAARALAARVEVFIAAADRDPAVPAARVPLLTEADRLRLLGAWSGRAAAAVPDPLQSIAAQFDRQAARTPDAVALRTWQASLTYRELDVRASQVARALRQRGVTAGQVVGVFVERSIDMVVAVLGVLKAGAAYLPLDPAYPRERIAFILDDAQVTHVVTHAAAADRLGVRPTPPLLVDRLEDVASDRLAPSAVRGAHDLAYVIYTSGSTGRPKGVMLEHGNVTSFFAAMDARIDHDPPGVWLAVTSLSFDISVLELLWTLCRGFTVVLQLTPWGDGDSAAARPIDLSLFYFASEDGDAPGDRYQLLMDGARFADHEGFLAVWTPERHFHAFGGLYPNPAITSAAVAAVTSRVRIRAGSLVLPLHHPVRAAEDWALVDNLSHGRVDIAFASGWHPNDFVLAPQNHAAAKTVMFDGLTTMRRLWRGESVTLPGPGGRDVTVQTLPRPVQPELPYWITTAGNPATFEQAGTIGANVLTHLLGQTIEDVGAKIRAYRDARQRAGHAGPGHVTLMLHTFVGESDEEVRRIVREPMKRYLGTSLNLVRQHAWSFPAFKGRPVDPQAATETLFNSLSPEDLDALLDHAFERYFETGGLFGSVETCVAIVDRLRAIGVDEIACLIDFGVPTDTALAGLHQLSALRRRVTASERAGEPAIAESLAGAGVTHFQCTPSLATALVSHPAAAAALGRLRHWLIGGEPLPQALAERVAATGVGRVSNMYGPTETTVWSLMHDLTRDDSVVPIGRPIAGTTVYIVDGHGELAPPGVEGELHIGGPGVARGYWARPELTAERFVPDRFAGTPGARLYRTGDRVRFRNDGVVEFVGRADQQVKIRGHRVELGEVEAALGRVPGVRAAAATVHDDPNGDRRLAGYVTAADAAPGLELRCREALRAWLPAAMVPSTVVVLQALPLTPNGKVDRRALPRPGAPTAPAARRSAPDDDLQQRIASIWRDVLETDAIGIDDNFFDVGGHSLLAVQVAGALGRLAGRPLPITDIFRFPTIRALARHLGGGEETAAVAAPSVQAADARASARRAALGRRRSQDT